MDNYEAIGDDEMDPQEGAAQLNLRARVLRIARKLKSHFLLFLTVLCLVMVLDALMYIMVAPTYTAVAVIGPPNPSPTNSLMSSIYGGLGGSSGAVRGLLGAAGGAGGSANDPFQEFLQLLYSNRLAEALVNNDQVLRQMFPTEWDAANHRWREPGLVYTVLSPLMSAMHRPMSAHPDVPTLEKYLSDHLSVTPAKSFAASLLSSSSYMQVSFSFKDCEMSQQLLNTILNRADELIRQEQMRDVLARINYINSQLLVETQAVQRASLIETLTNQEELKTMMIVDRRFSGILVDAPFASPRPTSPMGPSKSIVLSVLFALVITVFILELADHFPWLTRLVDWLTLQTKKRKSGVGIMELA